MTPHNTRGPVCVTTLRTKGVCEMSPFKITDLMGDVCVLCVCGLGGVECIMQSQHAVLRGA